MASKTSKQPPPTGPQVHREHAVPGATRNPSVSVVRIGRYAAGDFCPTQREGSGIRAGAKKEGGLHGVTYALTQWFIYLKLKNHFTFHINISERYTWRKTKKER